MTGGVPEPFSALVFMIGNFTPCCQWLFLVPLTGGRWHIIPQLAVYTTYILPSVSFFATYHLLGEPETTIDAVFQNDSSVHGFIDCICFLRFRGDVD